jgi:hypothetical protein
MQRLHRMPLAPNGSPSLRQTSKTIILPGERDLPPICEAINQVRVGGRLRHARAAGLAYLDVTGTIRLHDAPAGTAMFVGDVWLPPDTALAVVPRPGVADIAVVDPETMTLIRTCQLGRQPLVAVVVDGGHVVARDWKTGDQLRADLT